MLERVAGHLFCPYADDTASGSLNTDLFQIASSRYVNSIHVPSTAG